MKFTDSFSGAPDEAHDFLTRFKPSRGPDADERYLALLFNLASNIQRESSDSPLIVSITGAQGSGKSTLASNLAGALNSVFGVSANIISLDDFYLGRSDRQSLADAVHSMLATRGVPGTHDVSWISQVITSHRQGISVDVPVFNKATDDRAADVRRLEPARVLICEGWCWGAIPEPMNRLASPVNQLESTRDPDGRWRRFVNDELKTYQTIFDTDARVFLRVPSLAAVIRWRWQQEQELAHAPEGTNLMTRNDIVNFVGYYERLTLWMLEEMPDRVDVLVSLAEDHVVSGVTLR